MNRLIFSLCASAVGCAFVLQFPATAIAKKMTTETVVHSFGCGTDGCLPYGGMTDVNGTLYGEAAGAGAGGDGTVFSINPSTGALTTVYSFSGTDGNEPFASPIDVNGTLYSTTYQGGTHGDGTVFSLDPTTGTETVLYSFIGYPTDGGNPWAGVIDVKGMLYGTTEDGGPYSSNGTLYSVDLKTGAYTLLHSFGDGTDGQGPVAGLIKMTGTLYGTTPIGGTYGDGTVFSFNPKTGAETVVYSFAGDNGQYPEASLIDVNGTLYSTTEAGGTYGDGTVFSFNPKTGAETVLHSFGSGTDGQNPVAGLTKMKGMLYGTTEAGGTDGDGTVFSVNPATGAETVAYSFAGAPDGQTPLAGLTRAKGVVADTLYGTTQRGGTDDAGTVFAITKP